MFVHVVKWLQASVTQGYHLHQVGQRSGWTGFFSWLCKPQGARPNQQFLVLVLRLGLDLELDFRN